MSECTRRVRRVFGFSRAINWALSSGSLASIRRATTHYWVRALSYQKLTRGMRSCRFEKVKSGTEATRAGRMKVEIRIDDKRGQGDDVLSAGLPLIAIAPKVRTMS